jgi:hypothetical protein
MEEKGGVGWKGKGGRYNNRKDVWKGKWQKREQ